jgi:hypothetical protein
MQDQSDRFFTSIHICDARCIHPLLSLLSLRSLRPSSRPLDKRLDHRNRLCRLLRMHPVTRVEHLEAHVREEPFRDGDVMSVEVPAVLALEEQGGAGPLRRSGVDRRWGLVREIANRWDRRGEETQGDAEGEVAVRVGSGVGE